MPTPVADPAAIAAVQDVLKEVWVSNNLESQMYDGVVLLDWIEEVTEYTDSDGLKATVPLRTGRTGAVSARAIGEKLAPADHQKVGKASYNYKNLYLTIEINGPVMARMATNRQAVVREVDLEVTNGLEDFNRDFCRQLHGDGSAVITFAGLPVTTASQTVALGAANYEVLERGWLYEGQIIDIGTAANPTLDTTGVRITSIDDDEVAPTITVDTAVTVTAGSHISLYGNRTVDGSNEINGIAGIIDDTSELGGIDPTAAGKGFWKSPVIDHLNADVSIRLLNTLTRKVKQKGARVDAYLCDLALEQEYYELLQPQVRFAGETDLASGNVDRVTHKGKAILADPDARPNRVYALNKRALQMYTAGAVAWQNQTTGGDILAWKQEYDAFVARAAKYCELGTNRRRSMGRADNVAENV